MPLPTTATADFATLMEVYKKSKIEFPHLRAVTFAQWAKESGWGQSNLARVHRNYGGAKWRAYMGPWAPWETSVLYKAHDGEARYCSFAKHEDWIAGYWGRFDVAFDYKGWRDHVDTADAFINFIGPIWLGMGKTYGDAYVRDVVRIVDQYKFADEFGTADDLLNWQELRNRLSRPPTDGV